MKNLDRLRAMNSEELAAREVRLREVWERGRRLSRTRGSRGMVQRSRRLDRELAEVQVVRRERARQAAKSEEVAR